MSVISTYLDRPIAFQRVFVGLGVGVTGALMLSQAVYWSRRSDSDTGWFFKTMAEWEEETGLTRREQEGARTRLCKLGVFLEERRGIPAKLFFRVDFDKLQACIEGSKIAKQVCTKAPNKDGGNEQSGLNKTAKPVSAEGANRPGGKRQSKLRKTTTETTAETTADISSTTANAAVTEAAGAELDAERKEAFAALCRKTWESYADAYFARYGTEAVRNAKGNTSVVNLVKRLGAEAPNVARFFVERVSEAFVVRRCHSIGDLLAQCESYRTQWARDQAVTTEGARQADRTASNANAAQGAADKALAIVAARKQAAEQKGGGHA